MNPAVTFRPSGPAPAIAEGTPPPVIKVDLTPQEGTHYGDTATPGPAEEQPEGGRPPGGPARARPNGKGLIQELKHYRRSAWEARQRASQLEAQANQDARDAAQWRELQALPLNQRVKLAHKLGFTYDEHTQAVLKGEEPVSDTDKRIEAIEKSNADLRQELQNEREVAAVSTYKASINRFVARNPNRFPWILRFTDEGSLDEVYDVARLAYERLGEKWSIKRSAREVERYLDGLARRTVGYLRAPTSDAARPRGENAAYNRAPTGSNGVRRQQVQARPPIRGLSNRMTPSAVSFDRSRPARSDAEREARALAILRGQISP